MTVGEKVAIGRTNIFAAAPAEPAMPPARRLAHIRAAGPVPAAGDASGDTEKPAMSPLSALVSAAMADTLVTTASSLPGDEGEGEEYTSSGMPPPSFLKN